MLGEMDLQEIVLSYGALTTQTEADKPTISALKIVGLNLAVLPNEAIYLLRDSVIVELWAREQCALQVISEQKVNNT